MILCCGEALIDMIPTPSAADTTVMGYVPHAGGAIFNTAIALGRLGCATSMITGLSSDMFGAQLLQALDASQVATNLAVISARPTTLAFVTLSDGQARYTFYDENTAGREVKPAQMPALPDAARVVYFGGISLCNLPAAEAYVGFAERAQAAGRIVMLDPNIRGSFIRDPQAYRARLKRAIATSDIIKVSDEDLAWIYPDAPSIESALDRLLETGPVVTVLTKGSAGAMARWRDGRNIDAPAPHATVVDTVGAGDTFNAGLLAALNRHGDLSRAELETMETASFAAALGFGTKVAAVTVARAGANPPWAHELT